MNASITLSLLLFGCAAEKAGSHGGGGDDSTTNHAPGAPSIAIEPSAPDTTADLVAIIVEPATDVDEDEISYRYQWFQDGDVRDDLDTAIVASLHTRRGELWEVQVTAHDGIVDGPDVFLEVEIENSLPVLDTITITPSEVDELSEVECVTGETSDADHDPVGVMTRWKINEEELDIEGPLVGDDFAKGDAIICVAFLDDGVETVTQESRTVIVQNSEPWVVGVNLSSYNPTPDHVLEAIPEGWWDDDEDAEGYLYAWFVNWELASEASTIDNTIFSPGDNIFVELTAFDGETAGNTVASRAATAGH